MVTRDKDRHNRKRDKHDEHSSADHGEPRDVLLPELAAQDAVDERHDDNGKDDEEEPGEGGHPERSAVMRVGAPERPGGLCRGLLVVGRLDDLHRVLA